MANWRELGESNRIAAARLLDERTARPSVSRAYYAVYHELAHQFTAAGFHDYGKKRDGKMRRSPTHAQLASLIKTNIAGLGVKNRMELQKAVIRLRERRVEADYQPGTTVGIRTAKEAVRDMFYALGILSRAKGGV